MAEIIFSRAAQDDLERLYNFLVSRDRDAAINAGKKIITNIEQLKKYPERGQPLERKYRLFTIIFGKYGYSVAYSYNADADLVLILGIKHQKEEFFPFELENF